MKDEKEKTPQELRDEMVAQKKKEAEELAEVVQYLKENPMIERAFRFLNNYNFDGRFGRP